MRQVKGPPPGRLIEFVPTAYDNNLEISPIEMDILVPTEGERRTILAQSAQCVSGKDNSEVSIAATFAMQERVVKEYVKAIRNYKGASGHPIENGEDLVTHGETAFIIQAYTAITDPLQLTEVEKKTSRKSPDSTSQTTQVSGGIAVTA